MKNMTMGQHFAELRRRILWCLVIFCVAFCVGLFIAPWMQDFLTRPLLSVWPNGTLLYTGLADGMMIQLSLALMFALVVILPVGLWHVWAYVSPGLRENERKFIWPILIMSPILFVLGAGFAFWVLFPVAFRFFVELNQTAPVPAVLMPAVRDYLGFAIGMLRIFGIAFQLPLVMVLLNRIGVLKRSRVIKMRRYAIVAIVVVAAILTPPDIVSQVLLALPMWALFEISVCFMKRD